MCIITFILASKDTRDFSQLETLIWTTNHKLTDREVDQFLVVSRCVCCLNHTKAVLKYINFFPNRTIDHFVFYVRSVGTFARALDCSSSVKQPSLHMSAAAASRDITQVFQCTICTFFYSFVH